MIPHGSVYAHCYFDRVLTSPVFRKSNSDDKLFLFRRKFLDVILIVVRDRFIGMEIIEAGEMKTH